MGIGERATISTEQYNKAEEEDVVKSEQYGQDAAQFIVFDENHLASRATVYRKTISLYGEKYTVGELDNVYTSREHRGRGLATHNVRAATAYVKEGKFDLGILFCNATMVSFYERFGWQVVDNTRLFRGTGLENISGSRRMMMQSTSRTTLPDSNHASNIIA